jgi:2-dehydropantoate 2-reductase
MRIAIIGAGGVGGYYGALLARSGHEVTVYARGAHLERIQAGGLTVEDHGASFVASVHATNDVASLANAELAIVAVKSYSLGEVTPAVASAAMGGATIVPMLNGVEVADDLQRAGIPAASIVGGTTFVSASRVAPGVIRRHSTAERIIIGELDGKRSRRIDEIALVLRSTGVNTTITDDIEAEQWRKFHFICAVSAVCGLTRGPLGVVRRRPLGMEVLARAVDEIAKVARGRGVAIPADQEAQTMRIIDAWSDDLRPSLLLDVERGGPTELSIMSGAVSRLGRAVGIDTPVHDIAAALLPG